MDELQILTGITQHIRNNNRELAWKHFKMFIEHINEKCNKELITNNSVTDEYNNNLNGILTNYSNLQTAFLDIILGNTFNTKVSSILTARINELLFYIFNDVQFPKYLLETYHEFKYSHHALNENENNILLIIEKLLHFHIINSKDLFSMTSNLNLFFQDFESNFNISLNDLIRKKKYLLTSGSDQLKKLELIRKNLGFYDECLTLLNLIQNLSCEQTQSVLTNFFDTTPKMVKIKKLMETVIEGQKLIYEKCYNNYGVYVLINLILNLNNVKIGDDNIIWEALLSVLSNVSKNVHFVLWLKAH